MQNADTQKTVGESVLNAENQLIDKYISSINRYRQTFVKGRTEYVKSRAGDEAEEEGAQ